MKNFHQNLLIVLALGLCGLCVYQWYDQTVQRNRLENLNRILAQKSTAIQGYTNSLETLNHEVTQLDARITELKTAAATNDQASLDQKREVTRLQLLTEVQSNEISQYQTAVTNLQVKLQELADGVKKQNAAIAELTTQRDEFVQKLNESIKDRNAVVDKYNDLVKQVERPMRQEINNLNLHSILLPSPSPPAAWPKSGKPWNLWAAPGKLESGNSDQKTSRLQGKPRRLAKMTHRGRSSG